MAVKSIEVFDYAFQRADHFLALYDILHNSRQRGVRSDWLNKFKDLMHWSGSEKVIRIDGKKSQSMLILRESVGIDRKHFSEEFTGEILRFAIVAAISALDKYMHDIVVEKSWGLLNGPDNKIPKELAALKVPVLAIKKALNRVRTSGDARPGSQIKVEIQEMLHREFTFQNVSGIEKGAKMLGIENFWGEVATHMPGNPKKGDVQKMLTNASRRRNKIVHEADIVRKIAARKITQNTIECQKAVELVSWVRDFVGAMDKVFNKC